jgi:hypothetical protein
MIIFRKLIKNINKIHGSDLNINLVSKKIKKNIILLFINKIIRVLFFIFMIIFHKLIIIITPHHIFWILVIKIFPFIII